MIRWRRYHAKSSILLISIPHGLHESLHLYLHNLYSRQLVLRELERLKELSYSLEVVILRQWWRG
ncbi:hypothetical protein F4820DRAFT_343026 [Hypoxylon rubiginosum]|uniref:Uncharacterized protein n=1 Tax=Hypoxylon rubiginosum TaxID=110542 RepID=A0ACB9ZE18_9PEZI|nr:hypothetical protein F4820DRAFT_343026 [Hypoxylon rubiginosum]